MKRTPVKTFLLTLFPAVLIVANFIIVVLLLSGASPAAANAPARTSAKPATSRLIAKYVVNMAKVPAVSKSKAISPNVSGSEDNQPPQIDQLKDAAAHNPHAPISQGKLFAPSNPRALAQPATTSALITSFQGMADANSICPPNGCQAPDQALAVSPNWVLQGVNTSFAVYNTAGVIQSGWPKTAQSFFGVPNTPNGCSIVPYLIDVRAFYDPNDGRFWAIIMQNEDAFGHDTSCPFQALYWVAVSQTNNPNGSWNIYSFDMALGTTNGVDFAEFGFDAQAIYFTGNMFNQSGSTFQYAEIFAANKSLMESGASVTPHGFQNLKLNGVAVDSVQPVESETHANSGANVGLFINSLNYNFGGYACNNGCNGIVVWAMANPTSASPSLTSTFIGTLTYTFPPRATEPGCSNCLDTDETQILATPIYRDGFISFALNTGVNNGSQVVPGIFWGQVQPLLSNTGTVVGASMYQSGYFNYQGNAGAYYGALMPDAEGNLYMVFDASGSSLNPQVSYVERPVDYQLGQFQDAGATLRVGDASTVESLWGDFNATSYDGFATNNVWIAGEYAPSNGYWSTYIGELQLVLDTSPTPTPTPTLTPTPTPTATPTSTPIATPTPNLTNYSNTILGDHPVAYYRLDETSGTTAYDISGNGHNGTYTSRVTLNQSGATVDGDKAISCTGQAMTNGGGSSLPTGSSARSVEFWFKTTATPSSPYGSSLVAWGTESSNEMFAVKVYSSTQLKLTNWTGSDYFTLPSGANALDGKWHYVVATFDGSNATVYYDDQNLGTQSASFNTVTSSAGLVLGSQTGSNDSPYNGSLDEVAIYNQVLTATQILNHYNAGI